jgi:hypothetical protein
MRVRVLNRVIDEVEKKEESASAHSFSLPRSQKLLARLRVKIALETSPAGLGSSAGHFQTWHLQSHPTSPPAAFPANVREGMGELPVSNASAQGNSLRNIILTLNCPLNSLLKIKKQTLFESQ